MKQRIAQFIFKCIGWKTNGFPEGVKKALLIVMPHTSNWDFPLGILLRTAIGKKILYLGKSSLFKWPYGALFRWLGGYPVYRDQRLNFVQTVAEIFHKHEEFLVVLAPEGTRQKVDQLKTGFYYMALEAKVPLVMTSFDWDNKEANFSAPYELIGDYEQDLKVIEAHYKGIRRKIPENGYLYEMWLNDKFY